MNKELSGVVRPRDARKMPDNYEVCLKGFGSDGCSCAWDISDHELRQFLKSLPTRVLESGRWSRYERRQIIFGVTNINTGHVVYLPVTNDLCEHIKKIFSKQMPAVDCQSY